jgi:hypothetical protein
VVTVQGRSGPLGEAGEYHSVTALGKHLKLNVIALDWVGKRNLPVQSAFHVLSQPSVVLFLGYQIQTVHLNITGNGDPRSPFSRLEDLRSIFKGFGGSFALLGY